MAGIPASLGGATVMNAGAKINDGAYRCMADIVSEVEALDTGGNLIRFKREDLRFSYRTSNLKPYIILSVTMELKKEARSRVQKRIKDIITSRLKKQDWLHPSAGSFFKNTSPEKPAGRLIDQCGLKGLKVGGAQVSKKHANFIINISDAKSTDVIRLMEIVSDKVYNQFKIRLIPEVEIVS